MIFLALDPGIDQTGVAAFDRTKLLRPARLLQDAAPALIEIRTLHTEPADVLTHRLARLGEQLRIAIVDTGAHLVLIERPTIAGTYARHRKGATTADGFMPKTMQLCAFAIGALVATASDADCLVEFVTAAKLSKSERHVAVRAVWPALVKTNEDVRDALYLGLAALTNPSRKWVAA